MSSDKTPDWLDPATLRWCADREAEQAAYYARSAEQTTTLLSFEVYTAQTEALSRNVRRYRNRATRLERKRKGGGV